MDFETTFDEHYPGLLRYCGGLVGDRDVAEDLAQEAMVRLFEHRGAVADGSVRAWLFTTATHLVRDRFRVDRNRKRLLELRPVRPADPPPPDHEYEREQERRRVHAALSALGARDREMLLMRTAGFSYREIAEAVEVAATSVGTLLARAERRLVDLLREEEPR